MLFRSLLQSPSLLPSALSSPLPPPVPSFYCDSLLYSESQEADKEQWWSCNEAGLMRENTRTHIPTHTLLAGESQHLRAGYTQRGICPINWSSCRAIFISTQLTNTIISCSVGPLTCTLSNEFMLYTHSQRTVYTNSGVSVFNGKLIYFSDERTVSGIYHMAHSYSKQPQVGRYLSKENVFVSVREGRCVCVPRPQCSYFVSLCICVT